MFITFEGLDGAGSSTQSKMLFDRMKEEGVEVALTKEPTNNIIGGLIRGVLTHQWKADPRTLQLLFAADRGHHLSMEIEPWLQEKKIVISDRYFHSSLAFGSVDIGGDIEWISILNKHFRIPDITFYLKVPAEHCVSRIEKNRAKFELFEELKTLQKVSEAYEQLAQKYPSIIVVDGTNDLQTLHEEIYQKVKNTL